MSFPIVDKIVFAPKPMFRVNGSKTECSSVRVDKPWTCNFPSFHQGAVTLGCSRVWGLPIVWKTIWCRPFWAFSRSKFRQFRPTIHLQTAFNFCEVKIDGGIGHFLHQFIIQICTATDRHRIVFEFFDMDLLDHREVDITSSLSPCSE